MSAITKDRAEELYEALAAKHEVHHICRPDTKLVVEGYPRSSNSFAVDMIVESAPGILRPHELGHHTHEVANLQIADAYGIPKLVLIREPEDAILSFHIYSGAPIARCAKRYADFYEGALQLPDGSAGAHFREVTSDFGAIVKKLNEIGGFGISEDQDFEAIRERALAAVRGRVENVAEEEATRRVAAPNEKREKIKDELRGEVQGFLSEHPRAERLYNRVVKRFGLAA